MSNKKLMKKVLIFSLSATMVFSVGSFVYANTSALPNGTIINQNGIKYLTDSKGEKYSGWFVDSKEDWYYFNETDTAMKTGWYHDDKDGYWYYLNLSDGKMVTGWQMIDGKNYFFQPVRDMGNYHFNNEQEKWYYSMNSEIPYGAMYVNTTTPDGSKVNETGAKITSAENTVKDGWISKDGKWFYFENGTMATDKWLNLGGKWYYVTSDGSMINNGWKNINGKSYYFGSDGIMFSNAVTPDGKKVGADGTITVNVDYNSYIGIYESHDSKVKWSDGPSIIKVTQLEDKYIYGYFEIPGTNDDGTYFNFKAELNNAGEFIYTYTREHNNNPNTDDYGGRWEYKFQLSENNNRKVVVLKEVINLESNTRDKYDVTYYATQDVVKTTTVENGWISKDGKWYYYENGTMAKDKWLNISGKWYYVMSDGSMVSNSWKDINGKSYYFGTDGAMYANRTTPDGKKVDSTGLVVIDTKDNSQNKVQNTTTGYKWRIDNPKYHDDVKFWLDNGKLLLDNANIPFNISGNVYVERDNNIINLIVADSDSDNICVFEFDRNHIYGVGSGMQIPDATVMKKSSYKHIGPNYGEMSDFINKTGEIDFIGSDWQGTQPIVEYDVYFYKGIKSFEIISKQEEAIEGIVRQLYREGEMETGETLYVVAHNQPKYDNVYEFLVKKKGNNKYWKMEYNISIGSIGLNGTETNSGAIKFYNEYLAMNGLE